MPKLDDAGRRPRGGVCAVPARHCAAPAPRRGLPSERCTPASVPSEPQSRSTPAELRARFQRDVIPSLEPLYRHAVRMTRNLDDADDLLQDTMVMATPISTRSARAPA